jgi:uncharacterized protein YcbK (DUF882 family)
MITESQAKAYKLSKDFNLWEFIRSEKAHEMGIMDKQLDIPAKYILNLQRLCINVLQPLRDHMKTPIHVNSGYRCLELNSGIKGSPTSEHMIGRAGDIVTTDNQKAWEFLKKLNFRQLIKYGDIRFFHVSYHQFGNYKQVKSFK